MLADGRKVSMLALDRHLSQVLDQARDAPVSVQRYGQTWVWILSCDAWLEAARWAALDTDGHPLMQLRAALDALQVPWPSSLLPACGGASPQQLQRGLVLLGLRRIASAQRLHDGLRYNVLYRAFVGIDTGAAWTVADCRALLDASRVAALQACVEAVLAGLPPTLVAAVRTGSRSAFTASSVQPMRTEDRCLSY